MKHADRGIGPSCGWCQIGSRGLVGVCVGIYEMEVGACVVLFAFVLSFYFYFNEMLHRLK